MGQLAGATRSALTEDESTQRDIQQRNLASDALRLLRQHEAALAKAYSMALLEAFAEGPSQPKARPGHETGMDFGELALMDDADVLAQVELSRAQQIAMHATEASLAELNALVSSAQGLHSVQPERNPLRPENYIRALQQVVGGAGVSAEVRQLWMRHMRELLGVLLVDTYQRAASGLREQGVEPVGYAVAGAGPRSGYGGHGGSGPMGQQGASASHGDYGHGTGWSGASAGMPLAPQAEEALLTVGILRQMLAGAGGDPFALDAARGGYIPPEAAEAMEDIAQLERIVGRLAGGQPAAPVAGWSGAAALGPAAPARTAHEVVGRMMDHIAQDSRLLPPVQRAVQCLEPALKQLVRHDTRFFSDDQHPARRLLDELTQRSLAFGGEDAPGFSRFMRLVNEAVGHLATAEIRDEAPFGRVLKALENAWALQERKQREHQEAQQRELLQREQRELLAEKTASDLQALPEAPQPGPQAPAIEAAPQPDPAPEPAPAAQEPALRIGQWVEIASSQGPVRTQLTWCSPHNTLFLFTAPDGSTQSMTRRMIDKLTAEGAFRRIEAQPVVARALRAARTGKPGKAR